MTDTNTPSRGDVTFTRRDSARSWWILFIFLTAVLALIAFITAGNVFETVDPSGFGDPKFNVGFAFGAATAVIIAWLPVIALFDYLRRDHG